MAELRYKDKVVLITGSSSGIGKGCAFEFVSEGAAVAVSSNQREAGERVALELKPIAETLDTPAPAFLFCDVRQARETDELIQQTIARFGRLDCLINNAGWHPPHKPIDEFSVDEFQDLIDLNVKSVFNASKAALPHLRKTRGCIINIASLVATMGQRYACTYVSTKGAVLSFTKALAIDEASNGVRVNSISPGNIYTPLWQEAIDASADPAKCRADGEAAQVMGRMGSVEEVARLCLYLAADATFTTGVDHIISGGAELGYGNKVSD